MADDKQTSDSSENDDIDYKTVLFNKMIDGVMAGEIPQHESPPPNNILEKLAFTLSCHVNDKHLDRLLELPPESIERKARVIAVGKIMEAFPLKYSRNEYYNGFIAYNIIYNFWFLIYILKNMLLKH